MSRYCSDKEYNQAICELVREGWRFVSGRRHKKLYPPRALVERSAMAFLVIPSSPGSDYSFRLFQAQVKRIKEAA